MAKPLGWVPCQSHHRLLAKAIPEDSSDLGRKMVLACWTIHSLGANLLTTYKTSDTSWRKYGKRLRTGIHVVRPKTEVVVVQVRPPGWSL